MIKKKKPSTSADLSYDLNVSLNQSSSVILSLSKKHLIEKAGKSERSLLWIPMFDFNIMNIKKISSINVTINNKPLAAKKLNPKVEVKKLSQVLNSWFGSCEIVDSEIIYYPIYNVSLLSKYKIRHLKLSGVTGKFW